MKKVIRENDYFLLFSCLLLGIFAEISFFHGDIGISYLVFITVFYSVFFLRFKLSAFHHRRVGLFFILVIWLLSATYLFYGRSIFYTWNLFIIPVIILIHIIIITRPNTFIWQTVLFIKTMGRILYEACLYISALVKKVLQIMKESPIIAFLLGILLIVWLFISVTLFLQGMRALLIGAFIFGILQVLGDQIIDQKQHLYIKQSEGHFLSVNRALLYSSLLGLVMILFFFLYSQLEGLTNMFLMLVVLTLLVFTYFYFILDKVRLEKLWQIISIKMIHSLFIVLNLWMLAIHLRHLRQVDDLIGLTAGQFIQHMLLYFFMIIYLYTLIRIWVKRISLTHFYFIFTLLFYMILNVLNVPQIVADGQFERYENGEQINLAQFEQLYYPGYTKLIEMYEKEPSSQVQQMIASKVEEEIFLRENWQSYNFSREDWLMKVDQKVMQVFVKGEDE